MALLASSMRRCPYARGPGLVGCAAEEGRLNQQSTLLEGSIRHSQGARVRLDLSKCPAFRLFPGQVSAGCYHFLLASGILVCQQFIVWQNVAGPPGMRASCSSKQMRPGFCQRPMSWAQQCLLRQAATAPGGGGEGCEPQRALHRGV